VSDTSYQAGLYCAYEVLMDDQSSIINFQINIRIEMDDELDIRRRSLSLAKVFSVHLIDYVVGLNEYDMIK